jgi:rRNA maturation protein Nop10
MPGSLRHSTARRLRFRDYPDDCPKCGRETPHIGSTGECAVCEGLPWAVGPQELGSLPTPPHFSEPEHEFRWYRERIWTFDQAREALGVSWGTLTCWEGQEGPDAPDWALVTVKAAAGYT